MAAANAVYPMRRNGEELEWEDLFASVIAGSVSPPIQLLYKTEYIPAGTYTLAQIKTLLSATKLYSISLTRPNGVDMQINTIPFEFFERKGNHNQSWTFFNEPGTFTLYCDGDVAVNVMYI